MLLKMNYVVMCLVCCNLFCITHFILEGSQVTVDCLRVRKKIAPQNTSASVKECVVHSFNNCISSSLGGEVKTSNETAGGIS